MPRRDWAWSVVSRHDGQPPLFIPRQQKAPRLTTFELKPSTFRALPFLIVLLVFSLAPYQEHTFVKDKFPPFVQPAVPVLNLTTQKLTHVRQALPFTPNAAMVLWSAIGIIHTSFGLLVAFFSYQRHTGFRLGVRIMSFTHSLKIVLSLASFRLHGSSPSFFSVFPLYWISVLTFRHLASTLFANTSSLKLIMVSRSFIFCCCTSPLGNPHLQLLFMHHCTRPSLGLVPC